MNNKFFLVLCFLSSACHGQVLDHLEKDQDGTPVIIEADQSVVCDETAHTCIATGLAKAQKGTFTVYGDVLTVYFTDTKDITAMKADGHVRMETPTEIAYGDHAHYDASLDRVLLTGENLKITTQKEVLTAEDSLEYWHTKNQGIARGKAVIQFPEKKQLIQADTLIAYFTPVPKKEKTKENKTELDHVEATGNVLASGPNGVVTGERGTYFGKTELVEIFENVKITQGENIITGGYGRANLKTNVAELFPYPPHTKPTGPIKRISGIIIPKDVKDKKKNAPGL